MGRQYEADGNKVAAGDYSTAGKYCAVAIDPTAADTVALTTTDGQRAYGILQNNPRAGEAAEVATRGVCFAMCGAAVTRGDVLKAEVTTARLIPIAADGDFAICEAMDTGVDGQVIRVNVDKTGLDQVA